MRTIKFRGKNIVTGEWVYGNLFHGKRQGENYAVILMDKRYVHEVKLPEDIPFGFYKDEITVVYPNTVGQFTGLFDKDEKEIWEHDIVNWDGVKLIVEFVDGGFCIHENYKDATLHDIFFERDEINVIGNIHDNPELLK